MNQEFYIVNISLNIISCVFIFTCSKLNIYGGSNVNCCIINRIQAFSFFNTKLNKYLCS